MLHPLCIRVQTLLCAHHRMTPRHKTVHWSSCQVEESSDFQGLVQQVVICSQMLQSPHPLGQLAEEMQRVGPAAIQGTPESVHRWPWSAPGNPPPLSSGVASAFFAFGVSLILS